MLGLRPCPARYAFDGVDVNREAIQLLASKTVVFFQKN